MTYIQSDSERRSPHNFDTACAMFGAIENAQNVRLTSIEEIASGKLDLLIKKHVFAGSVDFMQAVFSRVHIIPPSLNSLNTNYIEYDLSLVRTKIATGETLFVKPVSTKLFTGMVFNSKTISQLASYPDDTEVLVSKPFEHPILSETRCYVHNNRMLDARCYAGDFRATPDWKLADKMLTALTNTPTAFTMDIAVLGNGATVAVEFNDMWAIGNYGMENSLYYQLLSDRYFEIIGINRNGV